MNAKVLDPDLYSKAKQQVYSRYKTHGAYRSGALVQLYKQLGGRYAGNKQKTPLKRWFDEKWVDVGNQQYPVYRPTVRVNQDTPTTAQEVDKGGLKAQIKLKQRIRGEAYLPKFLKK